MNRILDSVYCKPLAILLALVMLSISPMRANTNEQVVLKAGTYIPLELVNTISSKNATSGTLVYFRVVSNVMADGKIVIPAGSTAKGQVVKIKKNGMFGKAGELEVSVRSVTAVDGSNIYLSSSSLSEEGDSKLVISIVVFLFCLLGFLIKGGSAEIPAGTQCSAMVGSDTTIEVK